MDFKIWIIITFVICCKEVQPQAWRISTACYGNEGLNCSFHHFQCQDTDHIAVNGAEYFYKSSTRCGMGVGNCDTHSQRCCIPEQEDCSLPYTRVDVERLKMCLRKPPCIFKTPWSTYKCIANNRLIQFSSYSVIFYECIKDLHTIDFCDGSMIGNSVSVMYDPARHNPNFDLTCACMTSGMNDGHTPLFIEALDVHLGNKSTTQCSALTMNSADRDFVYNCKSSIIHPSQMLVPVNATLPIRTELEISKQNPPHRVWIRIQAKQPIKVTCRTYGNEQPTIDINSTKATKYESKTEQNIWPTVGGSIGGLLCIVTVCVTCVCFVRKCRKPKPVEEKDSHEYFEIEPSRISSVDRIPSSSEYYEIGENASRAGTDHYYSSADSLGRQSQTARALSPFVVSGYDHLSLKSRAVSPTAPNYGRLQVNGDFSESKYNRLNEKGQVVFRSEYDRTSVAV